MGKILVVEDDASFRRILSYFGGHSYHSVLAAAHGGEGIELLRLHPDTRIAFVDFNMPVMDGYTFCERVRPEYPALPLIGIGDFPPGKRDLLTELLPKPFSRGQFRQLLEKYAV